MRRLWKSATSCRLSVFGRLSGGGWCSFSSIGFCLFNNVSFARERTNHYRPYSKYTVLTVLVLWFWRDTGGAATLWRDKASAFYPFQRRQTPWWQWEEYHLPRRRHLLLKEENQKSRRRRKDEKTCWLDSRDDLSSQTKPSLCMCVSNYLLSISTLGNRKCRRVSATSDTHRFLLWIISEPTHSQMADWLL